ncbi:MAG TPA: hypothetical protein VH640_08115 [Bryobacteraceae bacterium]|jgi:hypothetical protein
MKTEVYSWRVSADLKADLEAEARRRDISVSALLDKIARGWIREHEAERLKDEAEQARIRRETLKLAGSIRGGNPRRSESVSQIVRDRLVQKYGDGKLPR